MRPPSSASIASRPRSSRRSNRRENRLASALGFMQHSLVRRTTSGGTGLQRRWISKNSPEKATETVGMTRDRKRVAWVTGGGTGIGEAGAEALATDGWTVIVSGRRKGPLDAVVEKIRKAGGEAEAIPLDVSVAANVDKAASQILTRHGRIDLQVN